MCIDRYSDRRLFALSGIVPTAATKDVRASFSQISTSAWRVLECDSDVFEVVLVANPDDRLRVGFPRL